MSDLVVVDVYPELTAPQGDVGNGLVLRHRAHARGIAVDLVTIQAQDALPAGDVYLLGGAEELAQAVLAERLIAQRVLVRAAASGAVVLGVGAGFQVLGEWFDDLEGQRCPGVGLLDVRTVQAVELQGPVVTHPVEGLGLPALHGFESHSGRTELGAGVEPFAALRLGTGNGGDPARDGAVIGNVLGTYVHGPLLARNPEVADLLLARALGRDLEPLPSGWAEQVREQRMAEDLRDPTGWGGQVVAH